MALELGYSKRSHVSRTAPSIPYLASGLRHERELPERTRKTKRYDRHRARTKWWGPPSRSRIRTLTMYVQSVPGPTSHQGGRLGKLGCVGRAATAKKELTLTDCRQLWHETPSYIYSLTKQVFGGGEVRRRRDGEEGDQRKPTGRDRPQELSQHAHPFLPSSLGVVCVTVGPRTTLSVLWRSKLADGGGLLGEQDRGRGGATW